MLKNTTTRDAVRVKICGITRLQDAEAAVRFGADAIGFIFAASPRRIAVKNAAVISRRLGPFVTRVGVFVNASARQILSVMDEASLDVVQLHGTEAPSVCKELLRYRLIKVFRVGPQFSPAELRRYPTQAHMLETAADVAGGSGKTWDWPRLARTRFTTPIIVTGGLNPSNVRQAIRTLRPYAVDVSSGVETAPGVKNHKLMEKFIRHAKNTR